MNAGQIARIAPLQKIVAEKKKAILLRISTELSDALHRWARDDLRSVNAQIEYILREAVRLRRREKADRSPGTSDPEKETGQN